MPVHCSQLSFLKFYLNILLLLLLLLEISVCYRFVRNNYLDFLWWRRALLHDIAHLFAILGSILKFEQNPRYTTASFIIIFLQIQF